MASTSKTGDSPDRAPGASPAVALAERLAAWRERLRGGEGPGQHRGPEQTLSGLALPDLFTPLDAPEGDYLAKVGFPGEYPFTRGVQASMYRGRLWTMRQYAGYASAQTSNARYRYLLAQGQTGLSVAFDLPTQIGYDPDHPLAAGEVGRVGVSIASLVDMERLFADIPLDQVSSSMTINATAPVLLAFYVAMARRRGTPLAALRGTLQNDILKEYIARGTYIFPPAASLRLVTDTLAYAADTLPRWNPISISGYHLREAGATAAQELGFTLANAIAYAEAAVARGLAADGFMPRLSFFFAAQNDLLEEVAKFRAARRLWADIARERLGARDPRSMALRFHTQTAGVTLTAQQPQNNAVRVALQALAAVLGGTQSLHTNAMDEALGLPTTESATLALRTQQILAHETGLANVVDPLGGSYAVEALTDRLEAAAADLIADIDRLGGAIAAAESGWMAARIAESAFRFQRELESGTRVVVGVNAFQDEVSVSTETLTIDPGLEAARREEMASLRAGREAGAVAAALAELEAVARSEANLMPVLIHAVEASATLGEVCDALRRVFGEHRPASAY